MRPLKVADLFCGVGGLSQGFIWASCEIAIGIEYDKEIAASYKLNHPGTDVYADDIRNIDFKSLHDQHPDIDIVIGGPPCQGFSQKGKRLSLNDERNYLFNSFVKFVEEFKPKYFVLENVPEITTTSNGFFRHEIISSFKSFLSNSQLSSTPKKSHKALRLVSLGNPSPFSHFAIVLLLTKIVLANSC